MRVEVGSEAGTLGEQEQVQRVQRNVIISRYVRGKLGLIREGGQSRDAIW